MWDSDVSKENQLLTGYFWTKTSFFYVRRERNLKPITIYHDDDREILVSISGWRNITACTMTAYFFFFFLRKHIFWQSLCFFFTSRVWVILFCHLKFRSILGLLAFPSSVGLRLVSVSSVRHSFCIHLWVVISSLFFRFHHFSLSSTYLIFTSSLFDVFAWLWDRKPYKSL